MRIALKNNDLEVCFKELGGELTSIKDQDGIEYLWQGDAQYWSGQAPVLFPICGSVRNDMTPLSSSGRWEDSPPRSSSQEKLRANRANR